MKKATGVLKKGLVIKMFAVLMMIGMLDTLAFSQTRIRFARGKSSTTINARLDSGYMHSYVLGARAGQTMTVSVNSEADIWLDIGGNDVGTGETIELRSTDDYIITVHNDDDYTARYSLYVAIR
ncbi:MAG: hypothetical protein KIS76_17855 [Pyrinomonadaceae bacterium]|nr:hypothetical protein [Pyrinomonadaceae bacterium]